LHIRRAGAISPKTVFERVLQRVEPEMLGAAAVGSIQEWAVTLIGHAVRRSARAQIYRRCGSRRVRMSGEKRYIRYRTPSAPKVAMSVLKGSRLLEAIRL
jgi:hypothetical protein